MNLKEIHLEPIPGINTGNEEEKKEAEIKANHNEQVESEKLQIGVASYQDNKASKSKLSIETRNRLDKFKKKMVKWKNPNERKSIDITPSYDFLNGIVLIDDIDIKIKDESFQHKFIKINDENTCLENTKKLFGYDSKSEKNPIKDALLNKIEQLKKNQREIDYQFQCDREIYLRKIKALEKACKSNTDETKLKKLEKKSKENKEIIREYKKFIEQAEKEKIKDNKAFSEALNGLTEFKTLLMVELKELEILAKKVTFQDYEQYTKGNPTKIEKINFRTDDTRYLLTNEYETSREEESFSSYDKLNYINNTPQGFDINKRNNSLSKTEQFFYNAKNFVGTIGNGNNINNSFLNNKISNSLIINNKNNKEMDKNISKKKEDLNNSIKRKSLNDMNIRTNNNTMSNNNLNNFGINNIKINNNLRNKPQINIIRKRINPSEFMVQDPEFLDKERIIIPDIRKGDSFY